MTESSGDSGQSLNLYRAAEDAALEPWALLQSVRDPAGRIVDFTYRAINRVAARQQRLRPEDLIGCSVAETLPEVARIGLIEQYAHVVETGEPLILDDLAYYGRTLDGPELETRRYEMRGVRVGTEYLSLNWRDVNHRYLEHKQIADSAERFRLIALNTSDVIAHIRKGVVVWVSPSVRKVSGAPPTHWIGQRVENLVPVDDQPLLAEMLVRSERGSALTQRMRLLDVDGVSHWWEAHVTSFLDGSGRPDGYAVSLRVIDDQVAAERELEQARRRQADIDMMYRQSMHSAAIGMCLADLEGTFVEVNDAICEFFGYDAETLGALTWQELTDPDYLQADLDNRAEIMAGTTESYRMTKRFIHADGHPIWGDLSVSCIRDADGQVVTFIGQIIDITDEVRAREELEQARALLTASADSMLDPQVLLEAVRDPAGKVCDFRYLSANQAALTYLQVAAPDLISSSALGNLPNLEGSGLLARYAQCLADGEPVVLTDFSYFNEMLVEDRRYDIRATRAGPDLLSLSWNDVTDRYLKVRRLAEAEERYRLLAENATDLIVHVRDGEVAWVSPSVAHVLGADARYWIGREVAEVVPAEDLSAFAERLAILDAGGSVQQRVRVRSLDGLIHWVHLHSRPFYDADGRMDGFTAALRLIDNEVAAEAAAEEARRQKARADAVYRRSMDSAAVGMCLTLPDGTFLDVNNALCEFLGYDAQTLMAKTWIELTPEDYRAVDRGNVADLLAGRIESYRTVKQYIHADGHLIWGELSVGCLRDDAGRAEILIAQVNDITAEMQSREQLRAREEQNRVLAQSLQGELDSAGKYLRSLLPRDLTGPVTVSSRYLPSQSIGGDCFDLFWLDDDHLIIYLLDVSGHGVQAALVAASVHNMLRSKTFEHEMLLDPERVLAELNRYFAMERHDGNYFTIWYGVYQPSAGSLRYAGAGHPPALLLADGQSTELFSQSPPVGMFDNTEFTADSRRVAPGCRILLYSDGAYELAHTDRGQWSLEDFLALATRQAGSLDWSLDELVDELRRRSATGAFDDDCCLVGISI